MTYQKPEVTQVQKAISAIQAEFSKNDAIHDGTQPTVDAYVADE